MKILVVDDSIVFRSAIAGALRETPGVEVIKSVTNGKLAVDALMNYPEIDLVTLDMEMPVMDGLTAILEIRKFNKKVIIIVFSSLTSKGAEKTIQALHFGADDFVTKPEFIAESGESFDSIKNELIPKILAFKSKITQFQANPAIEKKLNHASFSGIRKVDLIVIGCSTGGPEALAKIFKGITQPLNASILIVQHMPPMFTEKLAEMLDKISPMTVVEAKDGMSISPNTCYIAPGDFHMTLENSKIRLNQNEKVCFVRPSVDVLFKSLHKCQNLKIAAFVLTGMGEDGAAEVKGLKEKGVDIFIQDKESSIVWGMPGAIYKKYPDSKVLSLEEISLAISKMGSR